MSGEMRMKRIERLLDDLRYEVERGFMENEIEECIGFEFIVPVSRKITNGMILCRFETKPIDARYAALQPRKLKLVKK